MAFDRPTLTELKALAAQDIAISVPGSNPLLRFSNLFIIGQAVAGFSHLHYAYLDWIARQAVPYTAEGVFLEAWAAFKGVTRIPASQASGIASFPGLNGTVLPSGMLITRADGKTFTTTADATVSGGFVLAPITADADPEGLTGAWGDMDVGVALSLGRSVANISSSGVVSTAFTGGADIEQDDSLRERMLDAFRAPPHGGSADDYIAWAKQVPGVTRAWCPPSVMGAGTVQVFVMFDDVQAIHGGFPQGTNGVAALEGRDTPATGDQLAVANYIYPLRPVTALVYAVAPTASAQNFTIGGLTTASSTVKSNINAAIAGAFRQFGDLGGTTNLDAIEAAIASVPGSSGFYITSPTSNISVAAGHIPTLGTVTYP